MNFELSSMEHHHITAEHLSVGRVREILEAHAEDRMLAEHRHGLGHWNRCRTSASDSEERHDDDSAHFDL